MEPSLRLPLSHPNWLLFSFPSDGSAANLVAPAPPSVESGLLHIRHPQSASFLDLGRCKAWRSSSLRSCRQEALFSSLSFLLLFRPQENKSFHFPSPLLLHRDIDSLRHLKGCWKGRGWPLLPMQGELKKFCIWPCHTVASGLSVEQSVLVMPFPRGQPTQRVETASGEPGCRAQRELGNEQRSRSSWQLFPGASPTQLCGPPKAFEKVQARPQASPSSPNPSSELHGSCPTAQARSSWAYPSACLLEKTVKKTIALQM